MPVIIVGRDGQRHKFPDGFDPQQAAKIVRDQEGRAPSPVPTPPPLDTALPQAAPTTLDTTLGILNTVPRQLAQGAESLIKGAQGETTLAEAMKKQWAALSPHSKVTGETPLAALGMEPGMLRTGLGLAAEIAAPMGLPAKIGKAVGLGASAAKAAANPVGAALGATIKGAKMVPGVEKTLETVKKPFVRYQGLDKFTGATSGRSARDYLRLFDSELAGTDSASRTQLGKILGDLEETDRLAIASHLAKPKKHGLPPTRPDLITKAGELKQVFGNLGQAEVAQGLIGKKHLAKNYFPQVRKADENTRTLVVDEMVATDRHAKKKTLPWDKHLATGKAVDPMTAAQVRLSAGNRALKTSDFLHLMGQEFGQDLKIQPLREGWRRLDLRDLKVPTAQQEVLKNLAFPKEIAEVLEKGNAIMADPTGWRKTLKGVNLAFKTAVTQFNPAFHMNNVHGNAYMMHLGGMNPKDIAAGYAKLGDLHRLMGDGVTPQQLAKMRAEKLGSTKMTVGEAYDAAAKYNLFGSSEAMIDFNRGLKKTAPGAHPVGAKLAQAGDNIRFTMSRYVEDPARWALFKDQLLKGKTPEDAILHVKKHLFDYAELTDFEKGIRDYGMMPFYSWLRKNTELHLGEIGQGSNRLRQAQTLYTAPGRLGDPNGEAVLEDWQKEEGYQPIGGMDDEGNVPLMRLANPGLDINRLTSPLSGMAKGALGPIPTALLEGGTGRDLRTGAPLFGNTDGYAAASPLGTLAATLEAKTGIPMPRFGTVPNAEGTGMVQPERIAFAMNQIPLPLLPYAQRIAGAPGETFGSQLKTPVGQMLKEIILRSAGLTTRKLTPEQQDKAMRALLNEMFKPELGQMTKEIGEEMLRTGTQ